MQLVPYADWPLVPVNPLTGPACMKPEPTFPSTPPQKQVSPQSVWQSRVDGYDMYAADRAAVAQPPFTFITPHEAGLRARQ
jgi:hypothetical protein